MLLLLFADPKWHAAFGARLVSGTNFGRCPCRRCCCDCSRLWLHACSLQTARGRRRRRVLGQICRRKAESQRHHLVVSLAHEALGHGALCERVLVEPVEEQGLVGAAGGPPVVVELVERLGLVGQCPRANDGLVEWRVSIGRTERAHGGRVGAARRLVHAQLDELDGRRASQLVLGRAQARVASHIQ